MIAFRVIMQLLLSNELVRGDNLTSGIIEDADRGRPVRAHHLFQLGH